MAEFRVHPSCAGLFPVAAALAGVAAAAAAALAGVAAALAVALAAASDSVLVGGGVWT